MVKSEVFIYCSRFYFFEFFWFHIFFKVLQNPACIEKNSECFFVVYIFHIDQACGYDTLGCSFSFLFVLNFIIIIIIIFIFVLIPIFPLFSLPYSFLFHGTSKLFPFLTCFTHFLSQTFQHQSSK